MSIKKLKGLLRLLLEAVIHRGRFYPVMFGPLRGHTLMFGEQVNHLELLGLWERNNFDVIRKLFLQLRDSPTSGHLVMFDIGANFGLYTLFFSTLMDDRGRVVAFEPAAIPRKMLLANVERNDLRGVVVEALACAGAVGTATLYHSDNHHTSSLCAAQATGGQLGGAETIVTTTVDEYWRRTARSNERLALIKIDIEGAADVVLPHCTRIAGQERCFFLIESHSPSEDQAIASFARSCDYTLYRTTNMQWVRDTEAVHPERDGVWGTLLLVPTEERERVRRLLAKG